jgi:hypothetical protein
MTRDHRRKKAVRARAAATGRTYLDAATSLMASDGSAPAPLAEPLRRKLATTLRARGWPVEIEHDPQEAALRFYAGPATVDVSRSADAVGGLTGDEHPDDPAVFDLSAPLEVTVWAPLAVDFDPELGRVIGVDAHKIAGRSIDAIVAEVDQVVGAARHRDLTDTPARAGCGICGDAYPEAALFTPTRAAVSVCPCCAFDGDLLGADPADLAYQIDRATDRSVALPAGWAGVQVLLCCLGGPTLRERLRGIWRDNGTLFEPAGLWSDPSQAWIWLPPAPSRPAALSGLGCGASLAAVTAALDRAHPDLRSRFHARCDAEIAEWLDDEYGDDDRPADAGEWRVPEEIVERFWPAVVAYTVALLTQQAERPGHRRPWHVLESFELGDWINTLDPHLDDDHMQTVMRVGILTIRDVLDPVAEPET